MRHPASMHACAQFLAAVTAFCIVHGRDCYQGWPPETIFKYLAFQHASGGLVIARQGPDITGVLIAWRDEAQAILAADTAGQSPFDWRMPARLGNALMIGDVILAGACGPQLMRAASARWPDWRTRRIFTYRRNRLRELPGRAVERFVHGFKSQSS